MVWIFLIYLSIYIYIAGDRGPDWLGPDLLTLRLPSPPDLGKNGKKKKIFSFFWFSVSENQMSDFDLGFQLAIELDICHKIGYQINVGHWTKSFFFSSFKVELIWLLASQNISKIMTWHMSTFHGFGVTNFTVAKQKNYSYGSWP
jgi:hypothetical protein